MGRFTREMYDSAGEDLVERIKDVLETDDVGARSWFYTELRGLGNKRPYDFYREGKSEEVEILLGRMEHGVF